MLKNFLVIKNSLQRFLNLSQVFRALKHRNFRLFIIGQGISVTGTWMQQVAVSWLVYRMTGSAFILGLVGFSALAPAFVFSPMAGVISDRHNRRTLLLLTQSLSMAIAAVLTALVLSGGVRIWHILTLSAMMGLVNSFDMPIRQAFTVEMVDDKDDLGNAIALNSSMFNVARLTGPAAAGLLIAFWGEGICFFFNTMSYLAVIVSLAAMTIPVRPVPKRDRHVFQEMKDGFLYAFQLMPIRSILLMISVMSLMGMPYQTLMPVFAKDILKGGPYTLGFLVSMSGLGALTGAIFLAARRTVLGLGNMMAGASALFGIGVIAFALSRVLWLSLVLAFASGFGMMVQMAASNTVLQSIVDEDKRGRVMSFYTMALMGMAPFGSLWAGTFASLLGATATLCLGGIACLLSAVFFMTKLPVLNKMVHPIYIKNGIIPAVAKGLRAASGQQP